MLPAVVNERPRLFAVDNDSVLLAALERTMTSAGWAVASFDSAASFIAHTHPSDAGVLLLNADLADQTGIELQQRLQANGDLRPIIFMTASHDVPTAVDAMKAGALDYLLKPVADDALIETVERAASLERLRVRDFRATDALRRNIATLTPRELDVLRLVVLGRLNKQIASELKIAEITVKVHRAHVMKKLKVGSVAALVRQYDRLLPR
jgi:FixJ family two-component response regulator